MILKTPYTDRMMPPELIAYLKARASEYDLIPEPRRRLLRDLAAFVAESLSTRGAADLVFICTHNSRRSHLAQVWARVATDQLGIEGVAVFSGGIEATACDHRIVTTLRRAGLVVDRRGEGRNPIYEVGYGESQCTLRLFSKVYNHESNPAAEFGAVMVCSEADAACPVVPGCPWRLALPYRDPKLEDGTPEEEQSYDDRSRQICREMLFVFTLIAVTGDAGTAPSGSS